MDLNGNGRTPLVIGSLVDSGGVARAKVVPASHVDELATVGMGASPSWSVCCADDALAFTERFSVVGDLRLRLDAAATREIDDGITWGPLTVWTQSGAPSPTCTRTALARAVELLASQGITALIGHELEFVLFPVDSAWGAYGLGPALRNRRFLQAILDRAARADLEVRQLHAEAAPGQFELSLVARQPVQAADDLMAARAIVSLAAREVGAEASFSPLPVVGHGGNGAHQHMSFTRDASPLLSGGSGPHGLADEGAQAIAGILAALPDVGAVLTGSPLSAARLQPGMWSGAHACWGLENREAAVRLVAAGAGNPTGAHLEVKPIDPSANPYLASALLLVAAADGIERRLALPAAVDVDPRTLPGERAATVLPTSSPEQVDRLTRSPVAVRALGAELVEAITAVRRLEHATWSSRPLEDTVERFRFTWTC